MRRVDQVAAGVATGAGIGIGVGAGVLAGYPTWTLNAARRPALPYTLAQQMLAAAAPETA